MLNKTQLIEKLNHHFPSYEAVDGVCAGSNFNEAILFTGDNAYANFMTDHDENDDYVDEDCISKDCPAYLFLQRHGWDIEVFCERTIIAFKNNTQSEWDRLVEKSKVQKLTDEDKQSLKQLQKQMLNPGK